MKRQQLTEMIPRLKARAKRLCRNEADAEDLVQEALLRALSFEDRMDEHANLPAWMHTILRNAFISRCRRQGTRRRSRS